MPPRKERIELICEGCGQKHLKLPCQLTRGRGKFCSKACANNKEKQVLETICFQCGNAFTKRSCEMDCEKSFCSVSCYQQNRKGNLKPTTYKKIGGQHEHRHIVETLLRRKLSSKEIVHHLDENKHNNSVDNLALLPNQNIHALVHFSSNKVNIDQYKLTNLIK